MTLTEHTAIRVGTDLLQQADRLAATAEPPVRRSVILREAVRCGLVELAARRRTEGNENG